MRNTMNEKIKKYYCTPIARVLPIFFFFSAIFCIYMARWAYNNPEEDRYVAVVFVVFTVICFGMIIYCISFSSRYVLLYDDQLVCRCLFCKDIVLEYDKCTVGMDYATSTGGTNLWIYLVYGMLPKYRGNCEANRINSLKFKQGFVKIMYNEEVYNALLEVLPKKQRNGLISGYKLFVED